MNSTDPTAAIVRLRWLVRVICLSAATVLLWPVFPGSEAVLPSLSAFTASAALLAERALPLAAWLGIAAGLIAVVRHRWFCRWVCPTGLCADCASRVGSRLGRRRARLPAVGQWIAVITLGGAIVGYPLLLWLDPLGLFTALFRLGGSSWDLGVWYSAAAVAVLLVASVAWPNVWCGQVCPLGGLQDLLAFIPRWRAAIWRRLRRAPANAAAPPRASGVRVARRTVLGLALGTVWASTAGLLRGNPAQPLRPPGAVDDPAFVGLCLRCGNCVRACPTGIIAADETGHGLAGFLAPALRFDRGYCREDCVRCTEVCPSGALALLPLAHKPQVQIGLPSVDMDICLLGYDRECSACRRFCPYEAVRYVFAEETYTLVPRIDPQRCNGCGACELACPTKPKKAIQVRPYAPR